MSGKGEQADAAVLAPEANASLSTGQFAEKLARLREPIPADGKPFSAERVRQFCADEGMPGCEKVGDRWRITDVEAAVRWCRESGYGVRHHGGRAESPSGARGLVGASGSASVKHELMEEQRRRLKIGNERELGNLLDAGEVAQAWARVLSSIRLRMEQLPVSLMRAVDARAVEMPSEARRVLRQDIEDLVAACNAEMVKDPLGHEMEVRDDK